VTPPSPWQILKIPATNDESEIRKAYAQRLRETRPEDDPAGFARLRAAYEQALRLARSVRQTPSIAAVSPAVSRMAEVPGPAISGSAPAEDATPPPPNEESAGQPSLPATPAMRTEASEGAKAEGSPKEDLRRQMLHLARLASSAAVQPSELSAALDECLQSPALANLQVQLQFEAALADLLGRTQPRTQCLLEPAIEHFNWRLRAASVGTDAPRNLVSYADNVRVLENARTTSSKAHAALTRRPSPPKLRAGIYLMRLDRTVKTLLGEFGNPLPAGLDRSALEWWQKYFSVPRLRPELLWLTIALAALGAVIGATQAPDGRKALSLAIGAVFGALIGAGVAAGVHWLIDWPRHKLRTTRQVARVEVRLGWAPVAIALCFVAAIAPSNALTTALFVVPSAANVAWALLMAPEQRQGTARQALYGKIVINIPLLAWCVAACDPRAVIVTGVMWPTLLGAIVAFGLGQWPLVMAFVHDLSPARQLQARVLIVLLALGMLLLTWFAPPRGRLGAVVFVAMVALILVQRTAAANLTAEQFRMRYWAGLAVVWLIAPLMGSAKITSSNPVPALHLGGPIFMGALVLTVAMSIYNARRPKAA
jgi:hypothetical protein